MTRPYTPSVCPVCRATFDPTKDSFVTFYERKGPSVDLCSASCALSWERDEPVENDPEGHRCHAECHWHANENGPGVTP